MKFITKQVLKDNNIDSLALFKSKFSKGLMEAHTKNGYAVTLFVDLTHIRVPVRNKSFERILEIDKEIKHENEKKARDIEKLETVESVLNDLDNDIKSGRNNMIMQKVSAVSDLLHQFFPHKSLSGRTEKTKERFWKIVNTVLNNVGGKGGTEDGVPQTPA